MVVDEQGHALSNTSVVAVSNLYNAVMSDGEGRFNIEFVVLCETLDQLEIISVTPIPATNGSSRKAEVRVGGYAVRVEELLNAKPVTRPAGACRVVEGNHPGFEFRNTVSADRTGESI